jgi:hypothetical protein
MHFIGLVIHQALSGPNYVYYVHRIEMTHVLNILKYKTVNKTGKAVHTQHPLAVLD